jgi:hypothetical protein
MRAQGKGADEIAAQLGKERSSVIEALRGTPRPPPPVLGAGVCSSRRNEGEALDPVQLTLIGKQDVAPSVSPIN